MSDKAYHQFTTKPETGPDSCFLCGMPKEVHESEEALSRRVTALHEFLDDRHGHGYYWRAETCPTCKNIRNIILGRSGGGDV